MTAARPAGPVEVAPAGFVPEAERAGILAVALAVLTITKFPSRRAAAIR